MRQADNERQAAAPDEGSAGQTERAPIRTSRRAAMVAWATAMVITLLVIALNIIGRRQHLPAEAAAAPIIDELTSAATLALAYLLPGGLAIWRRQAQPHPAVFVLATLAGFCGFAAIHLGGSNLLRAALFPWLLGVPHSGLIGVDWGYELWKDALAYVAASVGFAVVLAWRSPRPSSPAGPTPRTLDIRDGGRLIRIPIDDILAVRAASNYVEFLLSDGRQPLMRGVLSSLETRLSPLGFVRTHRSWLVNGRRLTGLRRQGSGDYTIELGPGLEVPLSRRYRAALEALKEPFSRPADLLP